MSSPQCQPLCSGLNLSRNAIRSQILHQFTKYFCHFIYLNGQSLDCCCQQTPTSNGITSASNGRSPTRSMRIELAVSELEINVRRSMCELENMGIGRIGSLKQSLKPKIRCVYTKTNPCYRPANGLVPDMASILCMFSVRTPADSTDGDREFPQYIVFYRRG